MLKRMIVPFMVLAFVAFVFAADVSNHTTAVRTYPGYVMYSGSFATTTNDDSISNHYTKAMHIGGLATNNAYFYMVASNSARGTEDLNVYVEYSFDKSTWVAGSISSGLIKDQLTTTAVYDTINVQVGVADVYYAMFPYMRLKFDGQTGNPALTTITWKIKIPKDPDWPQNAIFAAVENSL